MKSQAQYLDRFNMSAIMQRDPRLVTLLQRLAMDRRSFFANGGWTGVSSQGLSSLAHILVRLHMLDHFVDALGFPRHDSLTRMPRILCPSAFPDRLKRVSKVHFIRGTIAYQARSFLNPSSNGPAPSTSSKGCWAFHGRRKNPRVAK
jgi:hypothetical protein